MSRKTVLRTSLNNVFYGGVATSAMDTLATGPFLIAYALMFGAGNIAIGFLGSIGFVGNLMHLYSAWLIEQGKTPKQISVFFSALSRPFYLIAALLAFWAGYAWALAALIVCFSCTYMIGSVAGGAWLPWMKALVPPKLMGRFFSHRFKWMMIAKMACYGAGALLIYYFEKDLPDLTIFAYSILLGIAFIIGVYGVMTLTRVENKEVSYQKTQSFFKKTVKTFSNAPFRKLLLFLGVLNFAINFVTPFLTVYMLKSLSLPMPYVIILTIISQTAHAFTVKYWGRLADKKNCQSIIRQATPVFMGCIALFLLCDYIPSATIVLGILTLTHLLMGVGQSALTLGMNNISLLHIPSQDASLYLSVNSVFKSFTSAAGSIIAGVILTSLEFLGFKAVKMFDLPFEGTSIGWTFFFILSLALFMLTFPLIKKVDE